ncbi:MAG: antibiotic biosynthesis monooxygenase [Treponema sp.]|uniref:putative quinol monooxygenase n=1 Tax=Treponema sp. TaxID=166 RepID=UPI0025EE0C55|nr:putative quinol monooxygenase [Treponema sp.]MBR0495516.1 antibiotic biosynthesis monooxygenase [Treponema sp.]
MAITVNLRYTGKKGAAQAFAREMISSGTVEKIRAEKGNLRYEYYLPFGEEKVGDDTSETILLIDSWENQEAIDLHHATPMMKTIAELREKYDLHMTIERFVSDDKIPEQDKSFIRS